MEKVELKKGQWTPEEDKKLLDYIQLHGHGNWRSLPQNAGLQRCGKSCRLRWKNYLSPDIKRGKFSLHEEQTTIQLHALLGNRWSTIANYLPGRTDNEIKNYWNTYIKKSLIKMGIDPDTHKAKQNALCSSTEIKKAANLSHMAQWETARLEAEAKFVRESKLFSSSHPSRSQLGFSAVAPPLPQPAAANFGDFFTSGENLESLTSISNFSHLPTVGLVNDPTTVDACQDVLLKQMLEDFTSACHADSLGFIDLHGDELFGDCDEEIKNYWNICGSNNDGGGGGNDGGGGGDDDDDDDEEEEEEEEEDDDEEAAMVVVRMKKKKFKRVFNVLIIN
ncbi:hypothetical protein LguiA_008229 [Lonicera macranthoides]